MYCRRFFLLVVFGVLFSLVTAAPQMAGETSSCFNYNCPPRTTGCKKIMKTSEDKESLVETVICLDNQEYELQKFTKSSANPYGPNTHYESTSFTGSYTFTSGGNLQPININYNNHIGNTNDDVELI